MATENLSDANQLRECGIYRLPDGKELVVATAGDGYGYLLYTPKAWQSYTMPEYRLQLNGRILRRGFITRWRIEDLHDTGRTINSNQPSSHAA